MATKISKSLKGRRLRITKLDGDGAVVTGSCAYVVTDGFITVTATPEIETGEEYQQKNAYGDFCIDEKDQDRTRWWNVVMEFCEVDPTTVTLVTGASLVNDGTDDIGVVFGESDTAQFAVELWTKQAATTSEYGYFAAPFLTNGSIDGGFTFENGTLSFTMRGEAQLAPASWGTGPHSDNPMEAVAGFPADKFVGFVRTTVAPPAVTDGCATLA